VKKAGIFQGEKLSVGKMIMVPASIWGLNFTYYTLGKRIPDQVRLFLLGSTSTVIMQDLWCDRSSFERRISCINAGMESFWAMFDTESL
jgi:hypothetical protein